jgi:hypothetical protein
MKWRKWFRVIHRDFGYLFFGATIVYAISGIALNHLDDWNPNFVITVEQITVDDPSVYGKEVSTGEIMTLLETYGMEERYKNHYHPSPGQLKVFLTGGSLILNVENGYGLIELSTRRPFFREVNYLHYNPIKSWTWFSDLYAGALVILAITGLFIIRGKKGITGRGAWLTILGIIIPVVYLFIYFY